MFHILLWRLWFEFLNVAKIVGYRGRREFYFAFGANLDPAVLNRRRIQAHSLKFTYLPDYDLRFDHAIPFQHVGFASVVSSPGAKVPGFLLEIDQIDSLRMDCFEACAVLHRYLKTYTSLNDQPVFFYRSASPQPGLAPTTEYLAKLLAGYRRYLPPDSPFLQALEAVPTIPSMVRKHPPEFLISDYECWGKWAAPWFRCYDELCVKVFVYFIFRTSIFGERVPV